MAIVDIDLIPIGSAKPKWDGVIYDNGTWNVPYDNSGYSRVSGYTSLGGATLNANSFTFASNSQHTSNRAILTKEKIDLSKYTKFKIDYSWNGTRTTETIDITNIAEGYVYVFSACINDAYMHTYAYSGISSAKQYFCSNNLAHTKELYSQSYSIPLVVYKVWLE